VQPEVSLGSPPFLASRPLWPAPLWHGLNGPMVIFLAITVFLAIPEHHSNGRDASNGHIASSWRSAFLHVLLIQRGSSSASLPSAKSSLELPTVFLTLPSSY
jgi:hypothetical protein